MNYEIFLVLLLIISTLSGFATEAVKIIMDDYEKTYHANVLAGIMAVAVSIAVTTMYVVLTEAAWTDKMFVYLIALVFLSWLSSMLGYDKVIQGISQFTKYKS